MFVVVLCIFTAVLGVIFVISINMLRKHTYISSEKYYDGLENSYFVRCCFEKIISDGNSYDSYWLFRLLSQIIKGGEVKSQLSMWRSMEERREEYIGIIEAFPVLYLFVIYVAIRPVLWEIIVSALVGVASAAIASIFLKGKADVTYEDKTWDREIDASKMTNQEAVDALEEYCTWIGNRRKELDDIVNGSCARTRNAISTTTWLLAIFSVVNIVVFCLTYRALL
jgi:hypothetical protein